MNDPYETITENGRTFAIYHDEHTDVSPRDADNLATLYCAHRRYRLGDVRGWQPESEEAMRERHPHLLVIVPLYAYEHGGITISTGSFADPWDSGQVGWAVVTSERCDMLGIIDRSPEALRKQVDAEVEEYARCLEGDVWGYVEVDAEGYALTNGEECWNLIGLDWARQAAREAAGGAS